MGDRIVSHLAKDTEIAARVAAHPALRRIVGSLPPSAAAVGGVVRDAALARPPGPDLDLVVEDDAMALAKAVGRALGARVTAHPRFLTAVVELPGGGHLDVVTARRERYPVPGALPVVEAGSLADDLARRDFSVNAMAVRLAGPAAGQLVDPHGGRSDLAAGRLRALRAGAFTEDPSRVVRAARYAGRLGLALDAGTEDGARATAPSLDPGSTRVARELRRLLQDEGAAAGLALLARLGVPWLAAASDEAQLARSFAALDAALGQEGAPEVVVWPLRLGAAASPDRIGQLALPGWARGAALEAAAEGPPLRERLAAAERPSQVDALLRAAPPASAVSAAALGAEAVAEWWRSGRRLRPGVRGADLVAAGIPPGPAIGRALARVRAALLDGEVAPGDDELALALRTAREQP